MYYIIDKKNPFSTRLRCEMSESDMASAIETTESRLTASGYDTDLVSVAIEGGIQRRRPVTHKVRAGQSSGSREHTPLLLYMDAGLCRNLEPALLVRAIIEEAVYATIDWLEKFGPRGEGLFAGYRQICATGCYRVLATEAETRGQWQAFLKAACAEIRKSSSRPGSKVMDANSINA